MLKLKGAMSDNTEKPVELNGDAAAPPKTEKQLKKEAEKAAKILKLQEKLQKKATAPVSTKEKVEVSFIENCIRLNSSFCRCDVINNYFFPP